MSEQPESPVRIRFQDEMRNGARIKVVGVGGGGNNAINRMIESGMEGVEFCSINTDIQSLQTSSAQVRLQLGARLTRGLGTGANPEIGRRAALEDSDKIIEALDGADMVFITAGLGGGTGTGAAPVIAALASQMGALTVAIVTRPFGFEGKRRMNQAEKGLQELLDHVDTLIVIPNEKLLAAAKTAGFFESFQIVDDVLRQAVQGISDIITVPGVINRDFADVKATMAGMGYGVMGTASRTGPKRASEAALSAITSPLLEAGAIDGARGILINITGSNSLKLSEVYEASTIIQGAAHEDANILFGAVQDERLGDEVKITVIATGFHQDSRDRAERRDRMLRPVEQPAVRVEEPSPQASYTPIPIPASRSQIEKNQVHLPETSVSSISKEIETPPSLIVHTPNGSEFDLHQTIGINIQNPASSTVTPDARNAEQYPSDDFGEYAPGMTYEEDLLAELDGPPFDFNSVSSEELPALDTAQDNPPEIARLRQIAMAAYASTSIEEDELEASTVSETASFAEVLNHRQKVLEIDHDEADLRAGVEEGATDFKPLLELHSQHNALRNVPWREEIEGTILAASSLRSNAPSEEMPIQMAAEREFLPRPASFALANAPSSAEASETITTGSRPAINKSPDFNHRLNRHPDFWSGAGSKESRNDALDRIPSFAVAHNPEASAPELDELDIPAFLRRRT